ncbi:MAG: helix-turn-helix transcriptional regulator [Oscillospiraceae bacterium]|nr:helix-turn-helix transcriptional regulator [Oscillospiraceae bacterium]
MTFSDLLHELAEYKDITQKQLAADLGIPASTIGGYFQGTSEPDLETVKRLAAYFGCSVDYLVGYPSSQGQSFQEDTLLYVFRNMSSTQQKLFIALGKTMSEFKNK